MFRKKRKADYALNKIVNCTALNVRSSATTESIILKTLNKGAVVECDKNFKDDEWDHVMVDYHTEGFCMKKFLTTLNPDKEAEKEEPVIYHMDEVKCDGSIALGEEAIHGKED